jgi:hypothetical protein
VDLEDLGMESTLAYLNHVALKQRINVFDTQIVTILIQQMRPLIDSSPTTVEDQSLRQELFTKCIYPAYEMVSKRHTGNDWGSRDNQESWSMVQNWISLLSPQYLPMQKGS